MMGKGIESFHDIITESVEMAHTLGGESYLHEVVPVSESHAEATEGFMGLDMTRVFEHGGDHSCDFIFFDGRPIEGCRYVSCGDCYDVLGTSCAVSVTLMMSGKERRFSNYSAHRGG